MKGWLGAAGKWDQTGAAHECVAEPAKGQAVGRGSSRRVVGSGSPPALWGTCGGLLTLLQPCWGEQGRAEVRGACGRLPEAGGCPPATDPIPHRRTPGSWIVGEVEGLTCLHCRQGTRRKLSSPQHDLRLS